ncbi:MAG TPA: DEAD/DEAH box helicase [Terriglobia bacterium]|nr:DEAD/DEAH box helicase [Terriglobia bacterium]
MQLSLTLTPHGRLLLQESDEAPALPSDVAERLERAFAAGPGHGLLRLGAAEVQTPLPPVFAYWREFASAYVTVLRTLGALSPKTPPVPEDLGTFVSSPPLMTGAEYLTSSVLESLWTDIDTAFRSEIEESGLPLEEFLKQKNPAWNLVGRVHFNLAENRNDDEAPFAFIATYTSRLSAGAKAQHLPLGQALTEYAGAANKPRLLSLLLPVQRAAEQCAWLTAMVDSGEIYYPLRWTPDEAFRLLQDLPLLESSGIIVRMPRGWSNRRPLRPQVTAKVGGKPPSGLGTDALLDFKMEVSLDGDPLTEAEIARLVSASNGLHLVRGRWVEIDREKLREVLERFHTVERTAAAGGLSFAEAMRLVSAASISPAAASTEETQEWSRVVAGTWFAKTLDELRHPESLGRIHLQDGLKTRLRPYQETGVQWLHLLSSLGLGACLADDMGLGKTMQVLGLLSILKNNRSGGRSILVAPASLLENWISEIRRFAPDLRAVIAHPSAMSPVEMRHLTPKVLEPVDLVITSYGFLARVPELIKIEWQLAIIDEAQAIKNPGTKQTRTVKELHARSRIALTGTPVENKLGDLWSIFDFINPGLLGSGTEFTKFAKRLASRPHNPYGPIRELVRPYILRRLKTDKTVIRDLPEKTEVKAFCQLSRKQAALYRDAVDELARKLERAEEGIERKGMVLSYLMRLKQICNHPSQWLGDHGWAERDSGKLVRLREIAETIAARQEKVLVFTQFRETTGPIAAFLQTVFGRQGLVLHGETEVRRRQELVRQFQEDETIPFFVLSLKAGGFGLNLTAASHVIHFDRWWNPAVENQATDRAFRIGQTKNVLVHKFVCRGTVEEKIDALIESKQKMSQDVLEGGGELLLTEMDNEQLLKLVALDIHTASLE